MKAKVSKVLSFLLAASLCIGMIICTDIEAQAATKTTTQIVGEVFDSSYYAATYPDVVSALGDSESALLEHYISNGIYEGRNASATFNVFSYKNRYEDLRNQFGDDYIRYINHYISYGKAENRNATPAPGSKKSEDKFRVTPAPVVVSTEGYSLLGSYTTKYNEKQDRATNVRLASERINGIVLQPGQEFSYSNAILPRTRENGYVEATVYINKEHARGIGGGICQVSSTLYACMKTIGLPATERHPHSLPVTYVPAGWDATISGTTLDLRFVNTYDRPLMITSTANNGAVTVSLYLKDAK